MPINRKKPEKYRIGPTVNQLIDVIIDDDTPTSLNGWNLYEDTPSVGVGGIFTQAPYDYLDKRKVTYTDSSDNTYTNTSLRDMYNQLVDDDQITLQDFFKRFFPTVDGDNDPATPDEAILGMTETLGAFFLCGNWLGLSNDLWLNNVPANKWNDDPNNSSLTHRELFLEYTQTVDPRTNTVPITTSNNTPIHDYMIKTGLLTHTPNDTSFQFHSPA